MAEQDSVEEYIHQTIGRFGKFQMAVVGMILSTQIPIVTHQFSTKLLEPDNVYICVNNGENLVIKCPCVDSTFDKSIFNTTILCEWELICAKVCTIQVTQAILLTGILFGYIIFGVLADRYGRKFSYIYGALLQIISMLASTLPELHIYNLFKFFNGLGTGALIVSGYVLMMEFLQAQERELLASLFHIALTSGHMILTLVGYYLKNWVHMHLTFGCLSFQLLLFYYLLPESIKWNIAVGKTKEAIVELKRAAKRNDRSVSNIEEHIINENYKNKNQNGNFSKCLMNTQNMLKNTIIICIIYFACGLTYYGMKESIPKLHDNAFIHNLVSEIVTVPAVMISIPGLKFMDHKKLLVLSLAASGAISLFTVPIDKSSNSIFIAIVVFSQEFLIISIIIICLLTIEYYPTVARATGLGLCLFFAGLGAIVSHFLCSITMPFSWAIFSIFGLALSCSSFFCFFLTETGEKPLPLTIEGNESTK